MSRSFAAGPILQFPTLAAGESSIDRRLVRDNVQPGSGAMRLTFFEAQRSETVAQVKIRTGTTAAAATPTLVRVGVYSVSATGDLTLVASTANDTSLFAAANTAYTKALQAPLGKAAGQKYAVGTLIISGVATPSFLGLSVHANFTAEMTQLPAVCASVNGMTDLPASVTRGALVANVGLVYAELIP